MLKRRSSVWRGLSKQRKVGDLPRSWRSLEVERMGESEEKKNLMAARDEEISGKERIRRAAAMTLDTYRLAFWKTRRGWRSMRSTIRWIREGSRASIVAWGSSYRWVCKKIEKVKEKKRRRKSCVLACGSSITGVLVFEFPLGMNFWREHEPAL